MKEHDYNKTAGRNRFGLAGATVLGLASALALASCSTATPYQPISSAQSAQGGYFEERIAPDYWRVTFAGNSLTSRETVEGYLLYRAAELTLQQGNDWFEVVGRETERNVREEVRSSPLYSPWWGYSSWRPRWSYYSRPMGWRSWDPYWGDPFFYDGYDRRQIERYVASAEIEMRRGKPANDRARVFDARDVIARLEAQIKRPE